MGTVELVVIVNSFNRLTLIQSGLPAIAKALSDCPFASAIVVFDAKSSDGTREWLDEFAQQHILRGPQVKIITPGQDEDSSFSAGLNAACSLALRDYPQLKWFLFYETDNWMDQAGPLLSARALLDREPELAAAGFTVTTHSGEPAGFGCSFPTAWQFLLGQQMTCWLGLDSPRLLPGDEINGCPWSLCDVVFTSPLLVRRQAWEQSHGMDAGLFPFSDCDLDWSWRLHKLGWKMAVIKTGGAVHDNRQELSAWSATRTLHFHLARFRLLSRHVGSWVVLLKPLLFIRHLAELSVLAVMCLFRKYPKGALDKRWLLVKNVFRGYQRCA